MLDHWTILADSDGDIGKLVFGVVALIIWGVSALASAAKKRQEQQRRRQASLPIARVLAPPALPLPPAPGNRGTRAGTPPAAMRAAPPAARMMLPPPPGSRRGKSSKKPPRQPTIPPMAPPMAPAPAAAISAASADIRAVAAKAPAVDARALRRWLTPATLRSQFMLTEVLQPPLALREPRG